MIECNGVEVLNYQFSDSSETGCVTKWGRNVGKIKFSKHDTASDSYEEKPTKGNKSLPYYFNISEPQIKSEAKFTLNLGYS